MGTLIEIKEEMGVVAAVGDFANALQQIAAMRMSLNRKKVLTGRRFVDTAEEILKELKTLDAIQTAKDIQDIEKHTKKEKKNEKLQGLKKDQKAVIVITSDQGLNGKYNYEIFKKVQDVIDNKDGKYTDFSTGDYFVLGKKGQEYFRLGKLKAKYFPYNLPENFEMKDLTRLVQLFHYYTNVLLIFSKFVNTTTRDVKILSLVTPPEVILKDTNIFKDKEIKKAIEKEKNTKMQNTQQIGYIGEDIKFIFEPSLGELIANVSETLRAAAIRQEILDGRLSHYASQMIGMKAASDNAIELSGDLRKEYNKIRRKLIDKKISEVFAGIGLW